MAVKKNKAKKQKNQKHKATESLSEKSSENILQPGFWMASSVLLCILLIISVFTGGFGLKSAPSVEGIISQAEKLKQKTDDQSLKDALEIIKTTLQPFMKEKAFSSSYPGEKAVIVEYSDFQCPFCKKAYEGALSQIRKNFRDAVEIDYRHFPLSFHSYAQKAAEASECARDQGKFWDYHDMLFENQKSLDVQSLKKYAAALGIDTNKFNACLDNGDKAQAVQDDFRQGQQKGVSGTPAFFIGDTMISGAQPYENFLPLICKEIPNHDACKNTLKQVRFKMYVIEDKNCEACDTSRIVKVTSQMFSGVEVKYLDYNSKEGKELYDKIGLVYMPMYVMEKKVEDDPGFSRIEGALVDKGEYYAISPQAAGSTYDPGAEQCTNGVDDNGDGIVDCDDPKCAASLECREEKERNIDLFIMSDCPFGKKAVSGLKEALDNFGSEIKFDIHYIANEAGGGFKSLHGQYEVEEDIRQLCAKELLPDKYFNYIYCRSVNGIKGIDWNDCAKEAGLDTSAMRSCSEGEHGKELLRQDIKMVNDLKISASPTWLANNRYKFSGIDAETIRSNFCKYNKGVEGCENTLSKNTAVPAGAGCGT